MNNLTTVDMTRKLIGNNIKLSLFVEYSNNWMILPKQKYSSQFFQCL